MARLTDEIVDEIHATRLHHAVGFDYDAGRILADLRFSQQNRAAQGWTVINSPEHSNTLGCEPRHWHRFAPHQGAAA